MAGSLIEQLQTDAIDRIVRTSDLLRKALLVASKLDIPGVPGWIDKELSGYDTKDEVPPYRRLHGRVMARTIKGWIPVQFPTSELQSKVAEQSVYESVATIEELLSGDGEPRCNFAPEAQELLQEIFKQQTEFTCMLSNAKLAAILDEVRNRLLRWSMELDKAGIKGDGLRFTQQEKNVAHNIVVQGVMNVGVVGDVHSATNIAVGDHARANNIDFKDIQQLLAAIEPHVSTGFVPAADKDELLSLLAELKKGSAEGHVKTSNVERILRQVLRVVGKLGDHVLSAGIKVVVEAWMRGHGMVQ